MKRYCGRDGLPWEQGKKSVQQSLGNHFWGSNIVFCLFSFTVQRF